MIFSNRQNILKVVEHNHFQRLVIGLIVINAFILGLETSPIIMEQYGVFLKTADAFILKLFILELVLKIIAYGRYFFTRPWCIFDLCVVGIAIIPTSEAYSALRTLRVLRVLRLFSSIPTMRKVIEGLLSAIPGILSVLSVMLIFFYIFAVIGTHLGLLRDDVFKFV